MLRRWLETTPSPGGQYSPAVDIKAAIEYIRDTNPDRVIATAGATESIPRALRDLYDGWKGVHVSKASLCRQYGAERLVTMFEFAPGWVPYSGLPANHRLPATAVLTTARVLESSVVSGATTDFQHCTYTSGRQGTPELYSWSGVGCGHFCSEKELSKYNVGFAHAVATDSEVSVEIVINQMGFSVLLSFTAVAPATAAVS